MQPIYRHFGGDDEKLDYSEEAAHEMYRFETTGKGNLKMGLFTGDRYNGYAVGKHWMDVTIKMWLQDIRDGILYIEELYQSYPDWHWWLDRVVKKPLKKAAEN
jgi:hypothetical protein